MNLAPERLNQRERHHREKQTCLQYSRVRRWVIRSKAVFNPPVTNGPNSLCSNYKAAGYGDGSSGRKRFSTHRSRTVLTPYIQTTRQQGTAMGHPVESGFNPPVTNSPNSQTQRDKQFHLHIFKSSRTWQTFQPTYRTIVPVHGCSVLNVSPHLLSRKSVSSI